MYLFSLRAGLLLYGLVIDSTHTHRLSQSDQDAYLLNLSGLFLLEIFGDSTQVSRLLRLHIRFELVERFFLLRLQSPSIIIAIIW